MSWVRDHLRNTFPIPPAEVRRRKWGIALRHPLTWLPLAPLAAMAGAAVSPAVAVGTSALLAAGVLGFWSRRVERMEGEIVEGIIHDSNMAQDSEIISLIRKLARNGYQSYAVTLGSFASLKTKIERVLSQDRGASPHKERVGKLVDDLVFQVIDQLEEMAKIEYRKGGDGRPSPPPHRAAELDRTWEEMAGRVKIAHATLTDTWHNLDVLLEPMPTGETGGAQLDEVIEQLREETRIAEDVRRRFAADAEAGDGLEPINAEAEARIKGYFATGDLDKQID